VADYQDPGWGPTLRRWPLLLLPLPTITFPVLLRRGGIDGVTALRMLWLSFVMALPLFLLVLAFIEPTIGRPTGPELLILTVLLLASLAGVWWARSRPLDGSAAAGSYRSQFFLGAAFAEAGALYGFVGVFVLGALWPYLIGLPAGLLGLALIAPSRRDIERRQHELTARGSTISLGQALFESSF
jgi:hypothetical protein